MTILYNADVWRPLFTVQCEECPRKTNFETRADAEVAKCRHEDCKVCKAPLFDLRRPTHTHCAWCGWRVHRGCMVDSPHGTNHWCKLCRAEFNLSEEKESCAFHTDCRSGP